MTASGAQLYWDCSSILAVPLSGRMGGHIRISVETGRDPAAIRAQYIAVAGRFTKRIAFLVGALGAAFAVGGFLAYAYP
jgi:hypothetical protein